MQAYYAPVPDIVTWAETHFTIPETGRAIQLAPHQKAILRLMTEQIERDGQWVFRWQTCLYSTIKKSGKTTISAIVGRWAAETWGPFQEIYNLGNKQKQAQDRAFKMIRRSIELGPLDKQAEWDIGATKLRHLPTGSVIEALPVSDEGEAGGNQSLTIWTELWGFQYEEALRFWDELQPVLTRPRSLRFVDTYAGYEGESELLKALWNLVLNDDGSVADGATRLHPDLPVYGHAGAGVIAYIDQGVTARRMPWQQGEAGRRYYAQQEESERRHNFLRLHFNLWVSSVHALVPAEQWDALRYRRERVTEDAPVWLAADASIRGDCAALVAVTVLRDVVLELETWIWEPGGVDLDYDATILAQVEACMRRFRNLRGVCYDEWQLHSDMTRLARKYPGLPVTAFSQQTERTRADTDFVKRVREQRFRHSGTAKLREHIQNADGKEIANGEAVRIVKRADAKKIDGAVAASMASWYATQLWEEQQIVYDDTVRVNVGY